MVVFRLSRLLLFFSLPVALPAALQSQTVPVAAPGDAFDRVPAASASLTPEKTGDILEVRRRYQAAIVAYTRVEHPSAAVWNKIGIAYQMLSDLKDARLCYRKALQADPENPTYLNNMGTIEDMREDFGGAERYYRRAIKVGPASAMMFKNLGTNLVYQHKYEKGAEAYKAALALDPHVFDGYRGPVVNPATPVYERGSVSYLRARSCAQAGLTDCALTNLRKAIDEGSATPKRVAADHDFGSLLGNPALQNLLADSQ